MKIKIPFVEIETEKECPCSSDKEYEIKIKCAKTKLHSKYLLIISALICIWLFSVLTYGDQNFVAQMSFASTIASIILSVLAIIMSLTGEGKTEHIKEQLESAAKDIKESQEKVSSINKTIEENLNKLTKDIDTMNEKIEHVSKISENTARMVSLYRSDITTDSSNVNEGIEI